MEGYTGVVVELVKAKANLDLQDEVCDMAMLYHVSIATVHTTMYMYL